MAEASAADPARRAKQRKHFEWQEAVLADRGVTNAEARVALRLALHFNVDTGRCNPSIKKTLVPGTGLARRTVQNAISALQNRGWLWVEHGGHGPGDSSNYRFVWPKDHDGDAASDTLRAHGDAPLETPERAHGDAPRAQPATAKGAADSTLGRTEPRPNTKNTNLKREEYRCDHDLGIEGEVLPPTSEQASRPKAAIDEAGAVRSHNLSDSELDEAFETFWSQCARAVDHAKANKIYLRIVRERSATPDELLRAMMVYAAARERAGDKRFDKTPATWLENGCWRDDPEAIAPRGGLGGVHRFASKLSSAVGATPQPRAPDPADIDRQRQHAEEAKRTAHRRNVDVCKNRIKTGYRSGPHWFPDAVYDDALAELADEGWSAPKESRTGTAP